MSKCEDQELNIENVPAKEAVTLELCAGIVDKSKPIVEVARDEIYEECGYKVPLEKIELVMKFFLAYYKFILY